MTEGGARGEAVGVRVGWTYFVSSDCVWTQETYGRPAADEPRNNAGECNAEGTSQITGLGCVLYL